MRSVTGTKHLSLLLDDQAVPKGHEVRTYSQGLQKWALRPCFEDRFDVWIPEDGTGNIMRTHVTGTDFGVAALEISESLDILAGATFEESDLEPPSSNSSSSLLPTSEPLLAICAFPRINRLSAQFLNQDVTLRHYRLPFARSITQRTLLRYFHQL